MSYIPEQSNSQDIQFQGIGANTDINYNPLEIALHQSIEYSPMGIVIFDRDMCYLAVSQKWLEDYNLTKDIIGRSHYEVFRDLPQAWKQIHQQCLAGAIAQHHADPYLRADGSVEWVSWSIRPWHLASGEIGGIMMFTQNITQQKQAEISLQQNEERYRSVITATSQIVWILPSDGMITSDIPTWREFTGQTLEEILGWGWLDALHPDDRTLTAQAWETAVKNGTQYQVECRLRRYDGEYRYMLARGVPVFNPDGSIREWVGTHTDIHDRKQTETALRESNTLLRSILESTPDFIVVKDCQGRHVALNSNLANFMGKPIEEIIGKDDTEVLPMDAALAIMDKDRQVMLTGKSETYEEDVSNGNISGTFLTTKAPWRDTHGNILGIIATTRNISDRKKAEEDLRQSNMLLRSILESTPDFVVVKDYEGIYFTLNSSSASFLGKTVEEVIGKHDTAVFPPEVACEIIAKDRQIIETGIGATYEEELSNGKSRGTYLTSKAPWRDAHGKILGIIAITRNISDRKQAELALQTSEERYRCLIKATSQMVWSVPSDGIAIYENNAWNEFTGQTLEEYQNGGWIEAIHPDDRLSLAEAWATAVNTAGLYQQEFRLRRYDGEYRYTLTRGVPVLESDGSVREWVGICTDIHESKQAELALQLSEERFRKLIEATSQIVWNTNAEGAFITDQPQWCAFTGQTFEEAKGWGWLNMIHPENRESVAEKWSVALTNRTFYEVETVTRRYDGEYRYLMVRGVPILEADGNIREWVGANTDITERKQAELVLAQAKEAAEAASHAKSEFLANMSHELRTPLNGILGYAQILQRSKHLNEDERSRIDVIYQCGSHLLTLINDILDLSKIEAQKVELMTSDFHFPAFLQGVAEMCRIRAELKGIQFCYQLASELPVGIRADEKRLRQVLINLLSNAIKFTDAGQVTFTISYASEGKIRFEVRDSGIGIPQEKLQAIFQPFEQAGDRRRQTEGTGLGLAISKRIVELMDSTIHVQSEIGIGSIFWFDVNLPAAEEWVKTSQADDYGQIIGIKDQKPKILVVDDKWENRSVIHNLLTPIGFDVTEANDGEEGWQKILDFQPDLVLTDLLMPELDGFELIGRIRQSDAFKHIIIIVSSASVFESDQHRSIEAGGNDFLPKPVQAIALFQKLRQYLNLEWLYEEQTTDNQLYKDNLELILPPPTELETLYELVMKGNFKGIIKQAASISQIDQKYIPFAKQLHQLAKEFQDQEILALIQSYK